MTAAVALLAVACSHRPTHSRSDVPESRRVVRAIEAFARHECPALEDEDRSASDTHVDVSQPILRPGFALATFSGPCQRGASTPPYNLYAAVVRWTPTAGVEYIRFAGREPDDVVPELFGDASSLVGAGLTEAEDGIGLIASFRRRYPDSGTEVRYRWTGDRFEYVETRSRIGGSLSVEESLWYPIVDPAERRCVATISIDPADPHVVRVERFVGAEVTRASFRIEDAGCSVSDDALECGRGAANELVEYTVVSVGDSWVVMRLAHPMEADWGAEVRVDHVYRVDRGCAL